MPVNNRLPITGTESSVKIIAASVPPLAGNSIEQQVKLLITEKLGLEEIQILPDAAFTSDLGIDSLDLFELLIAVENAFQFTIPAEESEKLTTPGKLISYIKNNYHEN